MIDHTPSMLECIDETVRRYYTIFPNEAARHPLLRAQVADGDELTSRRNFRGHITTSATVLNDSATRVLLIHHKFFNLWLPPGGHYEGDASLWDSGVREVLEETGVSSAQKHPWTQLHAVPVDIDSHPIPANASRGEPAHTHHDFRFLAIASDDSALNPQIEEVHEVRWEPVSALRNSPDTRVRALYVKLSQLNLL